MSEDRIGSEYRDRCELYAQEVWVCQCTGHTGLTHKEAWDSEHKIRNMLEASFPEFLHKPILSVVHHSTKSLDALIDEVLTLIHNRFHTGEVVICHKHDKARGAVVAVTDPENACNSPSSDKENKSGEPANGRFPPAHLPLRYTVRLEQSGRELANLTACRAEVRGAAAPRAERLPNRDMLRLFVRSNAVRQGTSSTAPWVVSPHLFVQLGLKNKIASIFLPQSERLKRHCLERAVERSKDGSKKKEKKPKDKEKKKKNKEGSQAKSDAKTKQTSSKEKKSPGRPKKDAKKQNAAAEKKPVGPA
ncbi:Tyrosine-protein kinase BAZ1B [Amphibalanus amphitrite]|uniref:Tyrosine-protein kinase BAZ1B n=1 Tax=Amphibalanus amphitrite TaxID=1232801 RepID=A0A6A4X4D1_AMPAM|nr:Tyrosine-protein kinase BAZ1B [Amphibalanus amphitrite]